MSVTESQGRAPTSQIKTFRYEKPDSLDGDKMIVQLAGSDIIRGRVQVVRRGGENNLHSHEGMDGFWMVLNGRVRFYGPGDEVIGEFGQYEGILIPRGESYWFESADESQDLELLQMAGFEKGTPVRRVDVDPQRLDPDQVTIMPAPPAPGVATPEQTETEKREDKALQKYICGDCDYIYDPEKGDPSQNVAPGTAFEDLPDTWECPECGAPKSEFYPIIESN
ncbi:MAG TPA: rubredoxin [Acidobacteriota bacterium]|nr:rubredoxin [Acidobacteriota bacterium]